VSSLRIALIAIAMYAGVVIAFNVLLAPIRLYRDGKPLLGVRVHLTAVGETPKALRPYWNDVSESDEGIVLLLVKSSATPFKGGDILLCQVDDAGVATFEATAAVDSNAKTAARCLFPADFDCHPHNGKYWMRWLVNGKLALGSGRSFVIRVER